MSPFKSDDLTEVIESRGEQFVVLVSSRAAGHSPDYAELAIFPTYYQAQFYLIQRPAEG
jgi:hypothetical protein